MFNEISKNAHDIAHKEAIDQTYLDSRSDLSCFIPNFSKEKIKDKEKPTVPDFSNYIPKFKS